MLRIAAATTAYARIHMIEFITSRGVVYTDTDSIFTKFPLPSHLIGKGLGEMKDELDGLKIKQAYFIDIKKYGYWFIDKEGNRVERSVISGVKRNSVPFNELEEIFKGKTVVKDKPNRFYKSMKELEIVVKDTTVKIDNQCYKERKGNKYLPLQVNTLNNKFEIFIDKCVSKIINQFNKIKKVFKL